jgi:opine dehydrogenase
MTKAQNVNKVNRTVAVVGAGGAGLAIAGYMSLNEYIVHLYDPEPHRTEQLVSMGGVALEGWTKGLGRLADITSDPARALRGVSLVILTVPATQINTVLQKLIPHLGDVQFVISVPGLLGASFEIAETLKKNGLENTAAGELSHIPLKYKLRAGAQVKTIGPNGLTTFAALPANRASDLGEILLPAFPWLKAAPNILHCGLGNPEPLFYATLTILNSIRIEQGGGFNLWNSLTPGALNLLEMVDRERVSVATALGVQVIPAHKYYQSLFWSEGAKLSEVLASSAEYLATEAPNSLDHPFFAEYIPCYMVPLYTLGERCGVAPFGVDALIRLASTLGRSDLRRKGRNMESMGLIGKNLAAIKKMLAEA